MTNDALQAGRHGILNPRAGDGTYSLTRRSPPSSLAPWVELYWEVRWDLRNRAPHDQETLPHPCVNLVFGTHQPGLHGPTTARFVARLTDTGWVVGCKFWPGMFRAFLRTPVSALTDRVLSAADAFGDRGRAVDAAIRSECDPERQVRLVGEFLTSFGPEIESEAELARDTVELARRDRGVVRVDTLAERAGLSVRALQRLFDEHVGVTPKWVIQRYRVHEAAELAANGKPPNWASLAAELGYTDQSHFIREFKAQVGRTPAEYAAECAETVASQSRADSE
jgi:AraC-like DNA-binding protein